MNRFQRGHYQAAFLLLSLIASPLFAAGVTKKVIIPVSGQGVPGENGSIWKAVLVGYNPNDIQVPVHLSSPYSCVGCYPLPDPLQPHQTSTFEPRAPQPAMGIFAYVGDVTDPNAVDQVVLKARVQDLSRQSQTWGTEIPVVREKDLRTKTISMIDVPTDERFRLALRIYDYDNNESSVRIRIVNQETNALLATKDVVLSDNSYLPGAVPAQVALTNLLVTFPVVPTNITIRVDVDPLTPNMRFWAFVSVTNNATQHVTIITPY